jgi:DNA phosphorothioation-associated putative methyltransferase
MVLALDDGLLPSGTSVFDFGCGHGGDVERLAELGYKASGWDPAHRPAQPKSEADVVNLGYVVNVIEAPVERAAALRDSWALAKQVLVVAARPDWEERSVTGRPFGDGILTSKGTFQRFFKQDELRTWIETTLDARSIAAAPGIFYVFRDDRQAQGFLAQRIRHPSRGVRPRRPPARRVSISEARFQANRELLQPLVSFLHERGRLPEDWEIPEAPAIRERFRSLKAAIALVRRVAGDEDWRATREAAELDLVIYLALAAFGGRPKFSGLPDDLQLDVKALCGSYKAACEKADRLLFSAGNQSMIDAECGRSDLGKKTPEALYVHRDYVALLTPVLRVYEGCAQALTGAVEDTTIVKLNRLEPKISYLSYPQFERDPHPVLRASVRADLRALRIKFRDFSTSDNPPILHRKETFVPPQHPTREKFARLTEQEEKAGLLNQPVGIGMRNEWARLVSNSGYRLMGHRLIKG